MMRLLIFICAMTFSPQSALAEEIPANFLGRFIHENAPEEVHYWGQLLGDWDVRWEAYDENSEKVGDGRASWHWYSTLGGFAIQDFYTHPMPADVGRDRVGINLRVFDKDEKKWLIRWSHNFGAGYEEYSAVHVGDEIVMYADGAENKSRIRFFDFEEKSFRQQEEKSDDGGKTWRRGFSAWATKKPAGEN